MKVFNINIGWDCAGVGYNLTKALNKYTNIDARQCVGLNSYLMYPYDIYIYGRRAVEKQLKESDILHFNHLDWNYNSKYHDDSAMNWWEWIKGKKLVYHNHGGHLPGREQKEIREQLLKGKLYDKYIDKAAVAVCSPNYENVYKGAKFVPNVIPHNDELYKPKERDWEGTINICHSPSVGIFKGANVVDEIMDELKKQGYDIFYERIIQTPHNACMMRKATCHIGIDSLIDLHPNISTFENMSLGLVTMTNINQKGRDSLDGGSNMPVIEATKSSLYQKLKDLLDNRDELQSKCEESRKWIEQYYTDQQIVKKWVDFYDAI